MIRAKASAKEIKAILKATFPEYRKREVIICNTGKVCFRDLNWSGGTRMQYRACTIDGQPISSKYNMNAPAPWDNKFEGKSIEVPVDCVIVEAGHFCGKPSTAYIHINPQNLAKLLTEN